MSKARDLANAGTALGAVSATELAYVDGVTSAIQTQIDSKIGSASAINPTIVDAKGDIIAASAADTPARLAVGNNGETLVADSSTATGLRWQGDYAAGKNKIINGDFGIWQRGTSFSYTSTTDSYTADRWRIQCNLSSGTSTVSQQSFTVGTAPVSGYESQYFLRVTNSAGATNIEFQQRLEDVRLFAGQTVTISFWAKASSAVTMANTIIQNFGSGGSGSVSTTGTSQTLTTSWARYSTTINVPSISGKTVGTSSYLQVYPMYYSSGTIASNVIDIWGVQVEVGSNATAFQTATGNPQGELAACQRYYVRYTCESGAPYAVFAPSGFIEASTYAICYTPLPVQLRIYPTSIEYGGSLIIISTAGTGVVTSISLQDRTNTKVVSITYVSSGLTSTTAAAVRANNSSTAYLGISAEL